jgi:hypothetical protein
MSDRTDTNPKDLLGVKKCPLRFVPAALKITAAPAMAEGARKYGPYNWREKKVQYTIYLEAIERHLNALIDGEDRDPKTGIHHESHIAANIGIVADARAMGCLIDDRSGAGAAPILLAEQDKTDG